MRAKRSRYRVSGGDDGSELESEDEVEGPPLISANGLSPMMPIFLTDSSSTKINRRVKTCTEPDLKVPPDDLPIEFEDAVSLVN